MAGYHEDLTDLVGGTPLVRVKGYRIILTIPDTMSVEPRSLLAALGAEVVLTEGHKAMNRAIARAEVSWPASRRAPMSGPRWRWRAGPSRAAA